MLIADPDPFGPAPAVAPKAKPRKALPVDITPAQPYAGPIEFTLYGEPASKANQRKIVTINGRPSSIKSDKARAYEEMALRQIPPRARQQLSCLIAITLRIYYASERPDLDESVVLDVLQNRYKSVPVPGTDQKKRILLQAGVYVNDRQVREKHVFHGIDKLMPRTEVRIESISPQGGLL